MHETLSIEPRPSGLDKKSQTPIVKKEPKPQQGLLRRLGKRSRMLAGGLMLTGLSGTPSMPNMETSTADQNQDAAVEVAVAASGEETDTGEQKIEGLRTAIQAEPVDSKADQLNAALAATYRQEEDRKQNFKAFLQSVHPELTYDERDATVTDPQSGAQIVVSIYAAGYKIFSNHELAPGHGFIDDDALDDVLTEQMAWARAQKAFEDQYPAKLGSEDPAERVGTKNFTDALEKNIAVTEAAGLRIDPERAAEAKTEALRRDQEKEGAEESPAAASEAGDADDRPDGAMRADDQIDKNEQTADEQDDS